RPARRGARIRRLQQRRATIRAWQSPRQPFWASHAAWRSRSTATASSAFATQRGIAMSSTLAKRGIAAKHRSARPFDEAMPHSSNENQRRVLEVPDLEQLPDQHRFQDCPDATRRHNERVRSQDELVQASKERAMLERLSHKRIDFLFEWQINANPYGLGPFWRRGGSFVGSLREPRSAARNNVASHGGQGGRCPLRLFVRESSRSRSSGAEDGHAIPIPTGRPEPRQIVDDIP